jgi:hypothetical protein
VCDSCWDGYGRPAHTSPRIERAAELTRELYRYLPVGGPLHIVVDDWNLGERSIRFCQAEIPKWDADEADGWAGQVVGWPEDIPRARAVAVELAALLLAMPEVDRAAALARAHGLVA